MGVRMKPHTKKYLALSLILAACLLAFAAAGGQGRAQSAATLDTSAAEARETHGALHILDKEGKPAGLCPLKHTDVRADISGFITRVTVTQEFANPSQEKIEAVYTFPLSANAAVDDMVMVVGGRTIRGDIKKKQEALEIYEQAKAAGHVASLLDQERPNIFTQSVANIMPGESVKITISYVEYLDYEDGSYSFVFPMVVGPRFMPGAGAAGSKTGAPDASRISPPVTPEGARAGHDISVSVAIDAGMPLGDITSELHKVDIKKSGNAKATVTLAGGKTIPNKDFVLKYKVVGKDIQDAFLTHAREDGSGFFTLFMAPPERVTQKQIAPKEMIFVIDTSGSMNGWPVEKAKETMKYAIRNMNPNDTFNLIGFSSSVQPLFDRAQPNTDANREKAERYLGDMMGRGGKYMMSAMDAALAPAPDPVRIVCFMTDGYVGNDFEIISYIQNNLGGARLFSFGIGNSVNRFLLDEMAKYGRGEVEYVLLDAQGKGAAERFHERIANPVLTDIRIDWGGLSVSDTYPAAVPDMFSNKPVIITGRYSGKAQGTITITGKTGAKKFERKIKATLPARNPGHDVLAPLWARKRIADLLARDYLGAQRGQPDAGIEEQITGLGLEYRLVTQYTSFVAVEERIVTQGGVPTTVAVPVEMPDGVSYEGIFGEGGRFQTQAYGATTASLSSAPAVGARSVSPSLKKDKASPMAPPAPYPAKESEKTQNPSAPNPMDKLAAPLQGLASKVWNEGVNGDWVSDQVTVTAWLVRISIQVDPLTADNLAALEALGLSVESKAGGTITGALDARKLADLVRFDFVKKVEPLK